MPEIMDYSIAGRDIFELYDDGKEAWILEAPTVEAAEKMTAQLRERLERAKGGDVAE